VQDLIAATKVQGRP